MKGRACLGSGQQGPQILDQFMRVYSVPRSQFFVERNSLGSDPRAITMRKDPVTYIVQPDLPRGRPGRTLPITLAAWSLLDDFLTSKASSGMQNQASRLNVLHVWIAIKNVFYVLVPSKRVLVPSWSVQIGQTAF